VKSDEFRVWPGVAGGGKHVYDDRTPLERTMDAIAGAESHTALLELRTEARAAFAQDPKLPFLEGLIAGKRRLLERAREAEAVRADCDD
jgi:hypothetical protein